MGNNYVVIAIDMRSSSSMLDNLRDQKKPIDPYIDLVKAMKRRIAKFPDGHPYKFTGDGWIVLFAGKTKRPAPMQFLEGMSAWYETQLSSLLLMGPQLRHGLSFGVDNGWLWEVPKGETSGSFQQTEYVGSTIVIACRLQAAAAAANRDSTNRDYTAFISVPCFERHFQGIAPDAVRERTCLGSRKLPDPYMNLRLNAGTGS